MKNIIASDFWQWAFSDFMSNALRGVLAEYIVACAADCTHCSRTEWNAYDLQTKSGLKIEVKSAAYLQSWEQKKPSSIRFDIASKKGWNAVTNQSAGEALRSADLYVFCIFAAKEKKNCRPTQSRSMVFFSVSDICTEPTFWSPEISFALYAGSYWPRAIKLRCLACKNFVEIY